MALTLSNFLFAIAFLLGFVYLVMSLISYAKAEPNKKIEAISPWWPFICKDCYPNSELTFVRYGKIICLSVLILMLASYILRNVN